jgi:hypothetical protein
MLIIFDRLKKNKKIQEKKIKSLKLENKKRRLNEQPPFRNYKLLLIKQKSPYLLGVAHF